MKKQISFLILTVTLLTGCTAMQENQTATKSHKSPKSSKNEDLGCIPLNYEYQKATWLPYLEFPDYMQGKSETEFKDLVKAILKDFSEQGINTVYFHIHPEGDAYYKSEIYPKGTYLDGDYDPLKILIDTAHSMDISVHGWINPYRMQTADQMAVLPDSFIVKKWVNSKSPMVRLVGNRWYLNPAYDAVTELISNTAKEIVENYCVDGIQIDDYFYPDKSPEFDIEAFEISGNTDLGNWRRENVTEMVQSLYDTVKNQDSRLKFGISPQGNIDTDYNSQYADVELWTTNNGYADYIVPQIYYGFENSSCPFVPTLERWEELAEKSDISLVIGLAQYKQGKYDKWAGILGENEWIDNPDVIFQQLEIVEASPTAKGYALYR